MQIEGTITNIVFQNNDNGYAVAQLKEKGKSLATTIVGTLPHLREGEYLICEGDWKQHKKFGEQFEVHSFEIQLPTTTKGILTYLSSGWISGIGAAFAKRIVDKFGLDTFDIIEHNPERLLEVQGLGKRKLDQIIDSWLAQNQAREIMVFLQEHGISPNFAQKIYKQYGRASVLAIKSNPYVLADDIIGISFLKADEIARHVGIEPHASFRIEAGILFILKELAQQQGHTTFPLDELLRRAADFLQVDDELVNNAINVLLKTRKIHLDNLRIQGQNQAFIWLRPFYKCEKAIADNLQRVQSAPSFSVETWESAMQDVLNELHIQLAEQQRKAVEDALQSKVHIITGGAGTGKSTIVNVLVKTFQHFTSKIILAAPTGRAAKRMNEVTRHDASTIHALLAINLFAQNIDGKMQQLDADVVIIDETSMVDTMLMAILCKSLNARTRLILVGDAEQLPSVGAGNVLKDLIETQVFGVSKLTEIFRQSAQSHIIRYAHQINEGKFPDLSNDKTGDFFFLEEKQADKIVNLVQELVTKRLPTAYNFQMLKEIQVISPMNKGDLGTRALNEALQQACNPNLERGYGLTFGQTTYCIGDKVIQTKNNYDKMVFNGDIGYITRVDKNDNLLWIDFEGRELEFALSECIDLDLAYAISVHKYQGSECPAVVLLLHEAHYKLLYRNLLYTAVTRGKKLVILIGSRRALQWAIDNNQIQQRYTGLQQLLRPHDFLRFPSIKYIPMLGAPDYERFLEKHHLQ